MSKDSRDSSSLISMQSSQLNRTALYCAIKILLLLFANLFLHLQQLGKNARHRLSGLKNPLGASSRSYKKGSDRFSCIKRTLHNYIVLKKRTESTCSWPLNNYLLTGSLQFENSKMAPNMLVLVFTLSRKKKIRGQGIVLWRYERNFFCWCLSCPFFQWKV